MDAHDIPQQTFTGPFYEQRRKLQNHDRRDNRAGVNPYPPKLNRLVALNHTGGIGRDGNPDIHARAWRANDKAVTEGIIRHKGGDKVPFLTTRIRDRHALAQEISDTLVTMPMDVISVLVKLPRERKWKERRELRGDSDAAAA